MKHKRKNSKRKKTKSPKKRNTTIAPVSDRYQNRWCSCCGSQFYNDGAAYGCKMCSPFGY